MGLRFVSVIRAVVVGLLVATSLGGCSLKSQNFEPLEAISTETPPAPPLKSVYRLGTGDEIEIKFFFAPELNDRMTIRPDGKISIMFAQDIQASGLTTDELAADIRAVLAPHVKQLDLVIIVRGFASQKVYVGGEVARPGPVSLTGDETLLQVLTAAGWVTPEASDTVVVVRRDSSGAEKIYPVDVGDLSSGRKMQQNVQVQAGDLILAPPSDAVIGNRWVDQYIRQMLPFTPGVGVSYDINGDRD